LRLPIRERVNGDGDVVTPLNDEDVERAAERLRDEGVEAIAICFLWSFVNAEHERRAAEIVRRVTPDVYVSVSSEVLPKIREYNRTSTTVLNAYVGPIVRRYVERTEGILRDLGFGGRIRYIQSNGGLAEAAEVTRRPVQLLMSGPAAAPAAGLQFSELTGPNFITLDMGGTSFDACLEDVKGYRVATRLIDVQTIGSGGGSIATLDAGLLRVGPESAEAHPGPACYRRGGTQPTVTDANVLTGFLNPSELLGGRFRLDASLAREAVESGLSDEIDSDPRRAANGVIAVVCRDMSEAIREITVRRGHDPRDYSLLVGGGAGGLHAAQLADELGVETVVVPRIASALCAYGAVVADVRHDYARSYVGDTRTLDLARLDEIFGELERAGRAALGDEAIPEDRMRLIRTLELRYRDQVYECEVEVSDLDLQGDHDTVRQEIESRFHERHAALYEFNQPGYPCQVVSSNVTAIGTTPKIAPGSSPGEPRTNGQGQPGGREVLFGRDELPLEARVLRSGAIQPDEPLDGPAIIEEPNTTIVVPPGWVAAFRPRVQAYELRRARVS
jgi:N-methylhydantoinase A